VDLLLLGDGVRHVQCRERAAYGVAVGRGVAQLTQEVLEEPVVGEDQVDDVTLGGATQVEWRGVRCGHGRVLPRRSHGQSSRRASASTADSLSSGVASGWRLLYTRLATVVITRMPRMTPKEIGVGTCGTLALMSSWIHVMISLTPMKPRMIESPIDKKTSLSS